MTAIPPTSVPGQLIPATLSLRLVNLELILTSNTPSIDQSLQTRPTVEGILLRNRQVSLPDAKFKIC